MNKTYNTEPVQQALTTAKSVLILLPEEPSPDAVAAGLALYLSLTKKSLQVTIGCSSPMTVNFNRLFAVDKIKPHIGNQNLVITFDYPEDSLEKVSYDKDPANQKFLLTIEPKAGMEPLDSQSVSYSYTGANADLIFVIGSRSLEDLGSLYQQERTLLEDQTKTLVNLSHLDKNAQFGTINLYDPTASGCSEIVFSLLQALELPLESDIATNLLAGIEANTANLTTAASADTFEIIAQLLRLGAQKGYLAAPTPGFASRPMPSSLVSRMSALSKSPSLSRSPGQSLPSPFPDLSSPQSSVPKPTWASSLPQSPQRPSSPSPQTSSPVSVPSSFPAQSSIPPSPSSQSVQPPSPSQSPQPSSSPSPDWLKPKVYKSSDSQT